MQLCSGAVNVHRRDDVCDDGETVQSMAVNPNGTILAVVTQLHLHFWTAGPKTVYLTSLLIPDTTLNDNPALFVIWRPRQGNHLAVVTARQVVFFEADINLNPGDFLQSAERQRNAVVLHHVDSASRVCYSCEIRIEAGITIAAAAAGPYAFLVTTTAGVVYVVGWHRQDVLHQWTAVGLQDSGHSFVSAAATERDGAGSTAVGGVDSGASAATGAGTAAAAGTAATVLKLASGSTASSLATAPLALPRGSHPSTPAPATQRVDPLQRRYQPPTPAAANAALAAQQESRSQSAYPEATGATINGNFPPTTGAALLRPTLLAPGGVPPPGAAVRSGVEERSFSASPSASPTVLVPPVVTTRQQHQNKSQPPPIDSAVQRGAGVDDTITTTTTDLQDSTGSPLNDSRHQKSDSFLIYGAGITETGGAASRSFTDNSTGGGPATASSAGLTARRSGGGEWVAGTILHAAFVSRWKVLSFVFSSGAVLLCRPSCGTNFTHAKVQLQGCVTPLVSAAMVSLNMRHLLVAVCTQAGALACRRIDGTTLAISAAPLWKGLRGLQDRLAPYGSSAGSPSGGASPSLGLIAALEWSPSEELLCVAFYKHGVVLVHYSGAMVTHHLAGPASATLLRCPGAGGLQQPNTLLGGSAGVNSGPIGCSFVSWKADGTRLWMAAPDQPCFFSTQLSRVIAVDTVGPTCGSHTPLTLLADNALYLVSASEATERQGVRELVLLPEEYLRDQFPLLYGAVSFDGSWIACAGRRGVLIFNRDRFSWKLASKKQEEMAISCVADPVWLRNTALAVPALRTDNKSYELIVLSTSSVSPSHALARVALEGKPSMLSCVHQDHRSEGYIVVVDFNQIVRVFRYDAFMDAPSTAMHYSSSGGSPGPTAANAVAAGGGGSPKAYIALTPVQTLVLSGDLANPLQVTPICLRREEDDRANPQRTRDQAELRLLLHRRGDHALVWLRGTATNPNSPANASAGGDAEPLSHPLPSSTSSVSHLYAAAEPLDPAGPPAFVYRCWVDRTPPVPGALLLTHEEEMGLALYHLQPSTARAERGVVGLEARRMEVTPTRDTELLPLCVSPFDGYVLCCGTDTSVPRQTRRTAQVDSVNAPAHPQLMLRPVLYAHRILSLLLAAAMPGGGVAPSSSLRTAQSSATPKAAASSPTPNVLSRATSEHAPLATPQVSVAEIDGRVASFMWDRALFQWLEYMRLNDTFVAVMDYFLHTALNESPPAAVPGLGRRSAIRAVIALLRNYPEFYTIVVGCVRKIDFTRWHLVLDFLGTPTALFRECVAHHCYVEAVHLVRVIMMGSYKPAAPLSVQRLAELSNSGGASNVGDALASRAHSSNSIGNISNNSSSGVGSLEQASQCAIELFGLSIENGDYTASYDLLRFMALLEDEIGMPAAGGFDLNNSSVGGGANNGSAGAAGASEGFLTRWLRQLTFSGAAYDDPEAAVEETAEEAQSGTAARKGKKVSNQIGPYATLVLDAARCEAGHGGRSADDVAEEVQRQAAVRHMFSRHKTLPDVVHHEALRLLLTGYVTQLAKLMETFSLSVPHFIHAACKLVTLSTTSPRSSGDIAAGAAASVTTSGDYTLHLHEVFDGLHKELGLPRSFFVANTAAAATAWNGWIVDQQKARAASLPGVLSATNPAVWTVAQSVLYATPQLRTSVESLHRLFRGVFVYNLAFCVLLMRKSDLISLLLSAESATSSSTTAAMDARPDDVSPGALIAVLDHLEDLLAVPENSGYKPFLQDVFKSLPPSALRAHVPQRSAAVVAAREEDLSTATQRD